MLSTRQFTMLGFLSVLCAICASFVMEYVGYEPCILCLVQRYCLILLAVLLFAAIIQYRSVIWRRFYWATSIAVTCVGLLSVARQLYLQHLPPATEGVQCLPGVRFFWEMGNYSQALKVLFVGSQECGKIDTLLGLSLAAWSGLFLFGVLGFLVVLFVIERVNQDELDR